MARLLRSQATHVALGLVAGLTVGMGLLPDGPTGSAIVRVLEPVGTAWINAVRMTVIPLVIPLLIVGVAGGDDARQTGVLGAKAFAWFLAMLVVCATASALLSPWLFQHLVLDPSATASLRASAHLDLPPAEALSLRSWLLGLIPANPIRAASDGALLPVVLFTLLYAFALGRLPMAQRSTQIAVWRSMAEAMLTVVRWILALGWLGIFALAVVLGQKLGTSALGAIGFYVVVLVGWHLAATIGCYVVVAMLSRTSVMHFARALLPAQIVAFGTRSSLAALPSLVKGATDVLELPATATGFVLPLGVSVFKLTSALYWVVGALFIGTLYGVTLSPSSIALVAASSVVLSFSTPGIPSGGMLLQVPLYAAIGLPVEGIGIMIALDTIPDMFKTLLNVTADMTVSVMTAEKPTPSVALAQPTIGNG